LKGFDGRIFLKTLATISTGGRKEWLRSILGTRAKKLGAHSYKKVVIRKMGIKHHFLVFNLPALMQVYYNYF
jgi:hypothetical protein